MPVPIPIPASQPTGVTHQPYYVRDRQHWAIEQERQRHNQALYTVGEYAMFVLMWHLKDHQAGLVARCPTCYGTDPTSRSAKVTAAYNQPTQNKCPDCFGTTFEGGWKAQIIRPTIFSDTDESEALQARGVVNPDDVDVESTTDFRVRTGDYVFRSNGDRWQLRVPQRVTLRTGFGTPNQADAAIGYNHARASLEDPNSVAYAIPPVQTVLTAILSLGAHVPYDFAAYETVRAPLIPASDP